MKRIILVIAFFFVSEIKGQTELWGMTSSGGKYGRGTIFKTNGSGDNFSLEHNWFVIDAQKLGSNVVELNGKLYGVAREGGKSNKGIIFEYDTIAKLFAKKFDFDGTQNGSTPYGSLTKGPDGMLYGLTYDGGLFNQGVLYQFNPVTNVVVKKKDLGNTNGANPTGNLLLSNGKLYGLTTNGGFGASGVLFEFDVSTNLYTIKFNFGGSAGVNPRGQLVLASDGKMYGLSSYGTPSTYGALFQYDPSSGICVGKVSFTGSGISGNGSRPQASLIQAPDGMLYGTAANGGSANKGTLFQYNPTTNICTKKVDFTGTLNGSYPVGSLLLASDGKLYGMTSDGGVNNTGILFQYDYITGSFAKKLDFDVNDNNQHPKVTLIQGSNGLLYGMSFQGLFSYNLGSGNFKYEFKNAAAYEGSGSGTSFIKATNGKLYGLAFDGGIYGSGIIFQYDYYSHVSTKVSEFNGINGDHPDGKLLQAANGKLYGLTKYGGQYSKGVIFEYDIIADTCIKLFDFNGLNGSEPAYGSLLEISGVLYGVTNRGGNTDNGIIFKYDISSNTFTKLLDFSPTLGASPVGGLIYAANGMIYGTTTYGGVGDYGVIFQFDPITENYTKKFDFSAVNGIYPSGSLLQANDGKLYGLANGGGSNGKGVLFQYYPDSNQYVTKYNFNVTNGQAPSGALAQASNGKLYGTAMAGIPFSSGVLFEFDLLSGVLVKKKDFTLDIDGATPYSELVELPVFETITTEPLAHMACSSRTVSVSYAITGTFNSGNVFTAELSDSLGSFISPLTIGSLLSTAAGSITATIPSSVITTNGYRIRVVSSNPVITGTDNGTDFKINPLPNLIISTPSVPCLGSSTNLISTGADLYHWNTGAYTSTCNVLSLIASQVYTVTGTNLTGCIDTQTVNVTVDPTCADVWPGDANSDGLADNLDILELGLHYTQTGTPRATTSNSWQSYFTNNWTGTITNGQNLNHSDCNGDGIIDDNDTLAIYNNYGSIHTFKTEQLYTVNPQLSIVPDQSMVVKGSWGTASVYLGDAINPINIINGIAFTVNFDNTLIETDSIYIRYQNSFLDVGQNLHFGKTNFSSGKVYTATTHTTNTNVNGYGKIATLHYRIKSALVVDQTLTFSITQVNQSNASGAITPLTSGTATLMAIGASVGLLELNGDLISISPNPTNGLLIISSKTELQKIEVMSVDGKILLNEIPTNVSHTLHLENLSNGIYFVNLYQNDRVVKREKIILNK